MSRIAQQKATKGSQKWLQQMVEATPARLDSAVGLGKLEWLSPLASDDWAEYGDAAFLERLGLDLPKRPLDSFWPQGGPVWDGPARPAFGPVALIEAKSHISELKSSCEATDPRSLEMIRAAFDETKRAFDADPDADWLTGHYQYANRLAHAYLLNELNGVPAELVFVYFVGDEEMGGPATRDEWMAAVMATHEALGVLGALPRYVHDVFVDVTRG